jgi:ubiquinone/menaquinone biosynthesis C-methylase UbiE
MRKKAIGEAARVLLSGGYLVMVDMAGYAGEYADTVKEMGWTDVSREFGGMRIMYGAWPCQILRARSRNLYFTYIKLPT